MTAKKFITDASPTPEQKTFDAQEIRQLNEALSISKMHILRGNSNSKSVALDEIEAAQAVLKASGVLIRP